MTEADSAAGKRTRGGTGNFFIVDQRLWKAVCDAGDINAAAAFLVLLRGTGFDQRTTAWSVDAIKRYLHLGYVQAKAAVDKLIALNFIRHGEKHTQRKPRYDFLNVSERDALTPKQRNGKLPKLEGDGDYNLIWVPNQIIDGAAGEKPPVYKLRASGDLWALRLFIDLYHEQNLRDEGGIARTLIWEEYKTVNLGERGQYRILGFESVTKEHNWIGPLLMHKCRPKPRPDYPDAEWTPGWASLEILEKTGLLTFVPHLMENGTEFAGPIHAFGVGGHSEHPLETQIGDEARRAASKMCHTWQLEKAGRDGLMICPVSRDYPNAQLVGIARLHYRAHTKRTSAWESNLLSAGPECIAHFRRLAVEYAPTNEAVFA